MNSYHRLLALLMVSILSCLSGATAQGQHRENKLPLVLPTTHLLLANLKSSEEFLDLANGPSKESTKLFKEFVTKYQELIKEYEETPSNYVKDGLSVFPRFNRKLAAMSLEYDETYLKTVSPKNELLKSLRTQFIGPIVLTTLPEYNISEDQYQSMLDKILKHQDLAQDSIGTAKTRESRNEILARCVWKSGREIYDAVLTREQKALWDRQNSKPLSEKQFMAIYLELQNLKDNASK